MQTDKKKITYKTIKSVSRHVKISGVTGVAGVQLAEEYSGAIERERTRIARTIGIEKTYLHGCK